MILFLDDEIYAKPYADVLEEKGLKVDFVPSVWQTLSKLQTAPEMYKLLILDCMLPANSKDAQILKGYDIAEGLRTGSAFLEYIVDKHIAQDIKIVVLTNILDEEFHAKYSNHPRLSGCYKKREVKPYALFDKLINLIRS